MNFMAVHDGVMYAMALILILATYVIIERMIFFMSTMREGKQVASYIKTHLHDKNLHQEVRTHFCNSQSPQAQALCDIVSADKMNHEETEYFVQSVYVARQPVLNARLWILDTVITLSPLLGLLGTILGIIDAFYSLSSGAGNSDPSAVSRGIGTALYATGFGIFIALYSMVFFNYFTSKVEHINNQIKLLSLTFLAQQSRENGMVRRSPGDVSLQAVRA
jgi:biopolymer transport protein ExbB